MLYEFLGIKDGSLGGVHWHDKAMSGFSRRSASVLARAMGLPANELMACLGEPVEPGQAPLSPRQSEALLRIALALHRLTTALGNAQQAAASLRAAQPALEGRVPLELLRTAAGTELVFDWIAKKQDRSRK